MYTCSPEIIMWTASFLLLLVALSGAAIYEWAGKTLQPHLPLILAFGGAFLIGLIFNHLVPETYALGANEGWFVLLGFMLQGLLEYLSQGIEHGHVHVHHTNEETSKMPWGIVVSLCLHALIESMPLTESDHDHDGHHHGHVHVTGFDQLDLALFFGLVLHKFPVALVLMGMLNALGISAMRRWAVMLAFGLMPLFGMMLYEALVHSEAAWASHVPLVAGGVLIGILLHISTTILFETGDGHRFNRNKLLVTIAGLGLAILTTGG
jgi:hypothetical protein